MKDIVYFDLETMRSADDVGGWNRKQDMGMSIGVTYSTKSEKYQIFGEQEVNALIDQLLNADLVVGYNHISFDYAVLEGYTILDLGSQTRNLDLMVDIEQKLEKRLKLETIASASLGMGKSADGLQALKWFAEYRKTDDPSFLMKIAEYCAFDVKVTKCVHEYGIHNGKILYQDRSGSIEEVEVKW